jgi:DNA-binding transcriptional regulator YhcF (GntR family)
MTDPVQEPLFPPQEDPSRPNKDISVVVPGKSPPGRPLQGWVQADLVAHDQMWKLGLKNATALPLLHYMISHMKRGTTGIVASSSVLAEELGVSPRTIQQAIQVLKQFNFVQILKTGNTNVYVINSQVAWRGNRGARHATFNATLRVSEKEQEATVEELERENANLLPVPDMSAIGAHLVDTFDGEMKEIHGEPDRQE